jgi:Ras-related GTP-binding protein A/B
MPNVKLIEQQLSNFCHVCEADEVVLFERTTFLAIGSANRFPLSSTESMIASTKSTTTSSKLGQGPDPHRFEKISNIIKQFKLSCAKSQAQFQRMEVKTHEFVAFVDVLTPNTFIMIVMSDLSIRKLLIYLQYMQELGKKFNYNLEPAATLINIAAARKHFESIEKGSFFG